MPPTDAGRSGSTRRDPLLLAILAAALLAARVGTTIWEHRHPAAETDQVEWVPAERAVARARILHRPILYDFSAAWCGPCQRMESEVFDDASHAKTVSALFVPVHVVDRQQEDGHNTPLVDSLQHACNVTAFPTLVIVQDGVIVQRTEGYSSRGDLMDWFKRGMLAAQLRAQDSLATHRR